MGADTGGGEDVKRKSPCKEEASIQFIIKTHPYPLIALSTYPPIFPPRFLPPPPILISSVAVVLRIHT